MSGQFIHSLAFFLQLIPAFLIVLSVHECAHAFTALLLGDDTAKKMGRLTLNPLAHIDPMGLLFLIIFRIGWAKPVRFDQRNFKHPRLYSVLTAFAGPVSNFVLAFFTFVLIKYFPSNFLPVAFSVTVIHVLKLIAQISVMLGVFNLLPIPPLDGSHILMVLFLYKYPRVLMWFYKYSLFIILLLFLIPQTRNGFIELIQFVQQLIRSLVF
jgi:Zn-dependent protease